ncbi:MAG: gliding motility-associated C-terminal domain-containing protein [Bacteroidetes bacterium]|nr:gliding motility-associated C-terminal domain-containing protein [Bacteroidota bacterium]
MKKILLFSLFAFIVIGIKAQTYDIAAYNGQTLQSCAVDFYATTAATYAANVNQTITFQSNSATNTHLRMSFATFDVDASDTLFVYDGLNTSAPLIGKFNSSHPLTAGQNVVQSTVTNLSGALTFKFVTNSSIQKAGWFASMVCIKACKRIIASLDTVLTSPKPHNNYIDLCLGNPINFVGAENFPDSNVAGYHQTKYNCTYTWDFGDGSPTATGYNVTHNYLVRKGYDIMLTITDSMGCTSTNALGTRVRISSKPTTIIKPLPDMCSGDTKLINVGYNPNSVILVEPMAFAQTSKQGFDSTMFIPDGPACPPGVYNTNVFFNNFPPGASIQNASDILAICVNIEHSFSGDLGFRVICPNNQSVWIDPNQHSGANGLGVFNDTDGSPACSAAANTPGVGWNYCWSEYYPNNGTLGSKKGTGPNPIDSTNTIAHTNYFLPGNPLSGLVGCPLNGTWSIEITDNWGIDNGYVFNWTLELTANLMPGNWSYDVKIDSVGFAGPFINALNDTTALISPTIGGTYAYNISLVDEFGCAWDTTTTMNVIQTPHPNLGSDTSLCYPYTTILDPGNIGTMYSWSTPSGIKTTQTITSDTITKPYPYLFYYVVAASNLNTTHLLTCTGKDTIVVMVVPSPFVTFETPPFKGSIIGCEPLSVSFLNSSTPANSTYFWDFGDGQTSTDANPLHDFASGNFVVSLTATSADGCSKTFSTSPGFVVSYPQPIADFTWNPPIGIRQNPLINFTNLTTPANSTFTWQWDFGDHSPTDIAQNPIHMFPNTQDDSIYTVTLISWSEHGNGVKCADTNSYNVKIIDDLLIFPNVLTPNGDGINDKFEIGALIRGGGYTEAQVIIYNRWGKKVYENNNYKNDFDGEGLPDGVYYVTIKAKGLLKNVEYKSSLQILR